MRHETKLQQEVLVLNRWPDQKCALGIGLEDVLAGRTGRVHVLHLDETAVGIGHPATRQAFALGRIEPALWQQGLAVVTLP